MMANPATPQPKVDWRPANAHITINGQPKIGYRNERTAARVAKMDGGRQHPVRPYRCESCRDWHLGGVKGSREAA